MADRAAERTEMPLSRGCTAGTDHDREVPEVDLLSPLTIRGVTLRNRIVMSPMCQYSPRMVWLMIGTWYTWEVGPRAEWRW